MHYCDIIPAYRHLGLSQRIVIKLKERTRIESMTTVVSRSIAGEKQVSSAYNSSLGYDDQTAGIVCCGR